VLINLYLLLQLRKNGIFPKSKKELQLDFNKLQHSESVYPVVGNLMAEAVDSFLFTKRSANGAVKELLPNHLECSENDKPMKVRFQDLKRL
jgi:hypothetical protein